MTDSLGVSIDVGTSNLTIHLVDLQSAQVIAERVIPNPQSEFGDEIISRMDAAKDPECASRLATLVRQSVGDSLVSMLIETMKSSDSVTSIVIVGNTAMHHLFYNLSIDSLLRPPYNAEHKEAILIPAADVDLPFSRLTTCYSPPIVESYVGADAIAMMIDTGFPESDKITVSIDVGTNTEIALLKDHKIWVTSAASGPAFEGMSIQCGVSGGIGAISSVSIQGRDLKPEVEVIGSGRPSGICGTGVVSAIASMLDTEILLPRGSFNRKLSSPWLVLDTSIVHYILATQIESATGSSIILTQPDVRMLQQSKAAIRGAFDLLLDHAELSPQDIQQLNLTGVFGTGLSIEDAVRIGLFPDLASAEICQVHGGAINGADLLHRDEYRSVAEQIAGVAMHINLTDNAAFKAKFAKSLEFPSR